ncbi:MAG: DUF1731 domain-containing protein [Akkermansia sp.]
MRSFTRPWRNISIPGRPSDSGCRRTAGDGGASQVVTSGQCAEPETLLREGFEFQYPDISTFFHQAFPVKS